jgi:hypothetical protein
LEDLREDVVEVFMLTFILGAVLLMVLLAAAVVALFFFLRDRER